MNGSQINEIDEAIKKTGAKTVRFHLGGCEYAEFPVVSTPLADSSGKV